MRVIFAILASVAAVAALADFSYAQSTADAPQPGNLAVSSTGMLTWQGDSANWSGRSYGIRWLVGDNPPIGTPLHPNDDTGYHTTGGWESCDSSGACQWQLPDFDKARHYLVRVRVREGDEAVGPWVWVRYTPQGELAETPPDSNLSPQSIEISNRGKVTWQDPNSVGSGNWFDIRWASGDSPPAKTTGEIVAIPDNQYVCDADGTCKYNLPYFDLAKHYLVQVRTVVSDVSFSPWVSNRHTPANSAPEVPTPLAGLTVNPVPRETTKLDVTWHVEDGADRYDVSWKTGDESYGTAESATGTSYRIERLTADTRYTVEVVAIDTDGEGATEAIQAEGEADGKTLDAMGMVTVSPVDGSATALSASWPAVNDATGYRVEWSTDGGSYTTFTRADPSATTETVTGLEAATTYTVRVTAVHTIGGQPAEGDSAVGSGTTNAQVPPPPQPPPPPPTPPPSQPSPPTNNAPTVNGSASIEYAENGTETVATHTATDPENDQITWSLSGTDAADFSILQGAFTFNAAPDYEDPADSDTNNIYHVTVQASDGTNTVTLDVTVTVTNVNEPPRFPGRSASRSVAGDAAVGDSVGASIEATDPEGDQLTYSLGGTDGDSFGISTTTGQIVTAVALERESYSVTVSVNDGMDSDGSADTTTDDTIALTITATGASGASEGSPTVALKSIPRQFVPINGDPTRILLSEHFSDPDEGYPPYQATTSDPALATVEVSEGYLTITPAGIGVATTTLTVSDTPTIREVFKVIVYRPVLPRTETETVHIIDHEVETTLTSSDGSLTVRLPAGARDQFFQAAIDTRSDSCGAHAPFGQSRLCVLVDLFDLAAESVEESLVLSASLSVKLGQQQYGVVQTDLASGDFSMWKGRGPAEASWNQLPQCGEPRGQSECFSLVPDESGVGGQITVFNITSFSEFAAGITVPTPPPTPTPTPPPSTKPPTDGTGGGSSGSGGTSRRSHDTFAYEKNRSPQISGPYRLEYDENGTGPVASYVADDPEGDSITWTLFGRDRKTLEISEDGVLSFREPPDFETPTGLEGNTYWVIVHAEDDGRPSEYDVHNVYVTVTNVNELGNLSGDTEPSVPEGQADHVAQYEVDDPEDGAVTWSLSGADASRFTIDQHGNLSPVTAFDFEAPGSSDDDNMYLLTITATDDGKPELSTQLDVAVTVANVNEAPLVGDIPSVDMRLEQASWTYDLGGSFTDPDGDSLAYHVSGQSIGPVATAAIEGGVLWVTPAGEGNVSFQVVAVDPGGLSAVGNLRVLVTDPTPEPTPAPAVVVTPVPTRVEVPEEPAATEPAAEREEPHNYWPLSERRWLNQAQRPDGLSKVLVVFTIKPVDEPSSVHVELPPYLTPAPQGRTIPTGVGETIQHQAPTAPADDMGVGGLPLRLIALLLLTAMAIAGYAIRMVIIHRLRPRSVDLAPPGASPRRTGL